MIIRLFLCAGLLSALVVVGCASDQSAQYTRGDEAFGTTEGPFRGRWWSYYERGNSFLSGEFYEQALSDYQTALQSRDSDSWRARTYGLHFVEYFPNRETGIANFHLGRLSEAEEYLTRSLSHVDTERAHTYLDRVKREQIARGERRDDSAPDLQLSYTEEVIYLSEPIFEFAINASDDTGISSVVVGVESAVAAAPTAAEPAPEVITAKIEPPTQAEKPPVVEEAAPVNPEPVREEPEVVAKAPAPAVEPKPEPEAKPEPAPEAEPEVMAATSTPDLDISPDIAPEEQAAQEPTLLAQLGSALGQFIKVAEETLYQRGSPEQLEAKKELRLAEGTHVVEVRAQDLANKETVQRRTVTVDLTGPNIGIFAPLDMVIPDASVMLQGAAADANGVVRVTLDGVPLVEADAEHRVEFEQQLDLQPGENNFVLMARDRAGNETHTAVTVYRGDPASADTKLWLLAKRNPELLHLASTEASLSSLLQAAPRPASEIVVKSPSATEPYRDNLAMRVSGEVITDSKVSKLVINGEPIDALTGAPREAFNRRIPLDPQQIGEAGTTLRLAINAEDENGQTVSREMSVKVEPIIIDSPTTRLPVAVLAFAGQGVAENDAGYLRDTAEQQLGMQRRFNILDRTRLQDVLTEQQLAASLADPNQAIQLGKLINAHFFLVGDVYPRGGNGYEVKVRAISTETSEIVEWLDVYIEDKDNRDEIAQKCRALAEQLRQKFPRLPGAITALNPRSPNEFMLNWTQDDGVRQGMPLVIVYETEPVRDETTGEVLWPGEIIEVGRGSISGFMPNGATRATLIERNEAEDVKLETGLPAFTM